MNRKKWEHWLNSHFTLSQKNKRHATKAYTLQLLEPYYSTLCLIVSSLEMNFTYKNRSLSRGLVQPDVKIIRHFRFVVVLWSRFICPRGWLRLVCTVCQKTHSRTELRAARVLRRLCTRGGVRHAANSGSWFSTEDSALPLNAAFKRSHTSVPATKFLSTPEITLMLKKLHSFKATLSIIYPPSLHNQPSHIHMAVGESGARS